MHSATQLEAARGAFQSLVGQLERISQDMRRAEQGILPAQQDTGAAQSLKQQKRGILARMLMGGRVDTKAPEVVDLDKQIKVAEASAAQSADLIEAAREVMAQLQERANALHAQLPAAQRALAEAQFEAATAEIQSDALPAFIAACESLRKAYGRLAGLGVAHNEFARELIDKHGVTVGSLGALYPMRNFSISAIGFGFDSPGAFNAYQIDANDDITRTSAEALARWKAA